MFSMQLSKLNPFMSTFVDSSFSSFSSFSAFSSFSLLSSRHFHFPLLNNPNRIYIHPRSRALSKHSQHSRTFSANTINSINSANSSPFPAWRDWSANNATDATTAAAGGVGVVAPFDWCSLECPIPSSLIPSLASPAPSSSFFSFCPMESLFVYPRFVHSSHQCRKLRVQQKKIPAVIRDNTAPRDKNKTILISLDSFVCSRLFSDNEYAFNTVYEIRIQSPAGAASAGVGGGVGGGTDVGGAVSAPILCTIAEIQRHTVSDEILDIIFQRFVPGVKISVKIPVHFTGFDECIGAKKGGGVLTYRHSLECWWKGDVNIPRAFQVDFTNAEMGKRFFPCDLLWPTGLTLRRPQRQYLIANVTGFSGTDEEEDAEQATTTTNAQTSVGAKSAVDGGKKDDAGAAGAKPAAKKK